MLTSVETDGRKCRKADIKCCLFTFKSASESSSSSPTVAIKSLSACSDA